jgi:beta-N-acetylhexosaminidase
MTRQQAKRRRTVAALLAALLAAVLGAVLVSGGGSSSRRAVARRASPAGDGAPNGVGARPRPRQQRLRLPSLRRLIGQRLMVGFSGTEAPDDLLVRIRQGEVGGVILFSENIAGPDQVRALTATLQREARLGGNPPLLIGTDQEGGSVRRFAGAPPYLSPPEMSASGDPHVAFEQGRKAGEALRSEGVNLDLAPVLDVASPDSFIAAESRSFGSSPSVVATYADAFYRGLRQAGVLATGKHFPGVGTATVDTDFQRDLLTPTPSEFDGGLMPYRALIHDGLDVVMLATAAYPGVDPRGRPAALSAPIQSILRRDLGFKGITITDALESPTGLDPEDTALAAAQSGSDMLLYATDSGETAFYTMLDAAKRGLLPRSNLIASYTRLEAVKRQLAPRG